MNSSPNSGHKKVPPVSRGEVLFCPTVVGQCEVYHYAGKMSSGKYEQAVSYGGTTRGGEEMPEISVKRKAKKAKPKFKVQNRFIEIFNFTL